MMPARYWTVEVFPVPVSPTSRTGSPWFTQTASCSRSTADGRVAANVWFSLRGEHALGGTALGGTTKHTLEVMFPEIGRLTQDPH